MPGIQKIKIDQQLAEIGLQITPAHMSINRPRLKMKITTEPSRMEIESQSPSFKVNRKKINSESGLKSPIEMVSSYKNAGRAAALKAMKTSGKEGDFLGNTRIRGDRIAKLSRSKAMKSATKKKQIDLQLMPKSSPEVEWDKGYMRINWSKHSVVIDWDGEYMPQVTVDPKYSVEVYMRTEPYFRVMIEGPDDPGMPGKYVDRAI